MPVQSELLRKGSCQLMLSACIAAVLAPLVARADASGGQRVPDFPASTLFVTNCDDDGPGSLRDVLAQASRFDTIDLYGLSCSLITLTTGELSTDLDDVTLAGNVTISAGGASRVLSHLGTGTLGLFGLEFSDGQVIANPANGGCIRSQGNVSMNRVVVHDCHLYSMQGAPGSSARGGGVYARGTAFLDHSWIFNNSILPAIGSYSYGEGAGVHAYENVFLEDSTISGNVIYGSSSYASGGGFSTRGGAGIAYSSIAGNRAQFAGAGRFGNPQTTSEIRNSTVSGNAGFEAGGIVSNDAILRVRNSTIVFNTAQRSGDGYVEGAGILALGDQEYLSLRSSIVAMNTAAGVPDDVCVHQVFPNGLIGFANLILTANVALPHDTIQTDPLLAPLADNGGPTLTHALLPGSPAIDAGNNYLFIPYDQRGEGFPRVSGNRADIGAFEFQVTEMPDGIFKNGFD